MQSYLVVSDRNAIALFSRGISGPVSMLNLLRFREEADYSAHPELAPTSPISGREAYMKYVRHTAPFLAASGGEILHLGEGGSYLIGPEDSGWDMAMIIRQASVDAFMAFASNQDYLEGIGHRVAALKDARILPLTDISLQ